MSKANENPVEVVVDSALPDRKEYMRPAIIHELDLETRAGSPTGVKPGFDPADPLGLNK